MTFLHPTSPAFIDANIFLHDVFAHPRYQAYCRTLLQKVESGEVNGVTSVMVLDEVLFKMLIAEASQQYNVPLGQVPRFLKGDPDKISTLHQSWNNIERIQTISNLWISDISAADFSESVALAQRYNLLPHDALHLAVIKRAGITSIITSDADFDAVDWVTVFKPQEI